MQKACNLNRKVFLTDFWGKELLFHHILCRNSIIINMWILLLLLASGYIIGLILRPKGEVKAVISGALFVVLVVLLFLSGVAVGVDKSMQEQLGVVFGRGFVWAFLSVFLSVVFAFILVVLLKGWRRRK